MNDLENEIKKTGKESLSYQYFAEKAEEFSNPKRQLTPELLMFVYNLIHSHKKTRQEAVEYVMQRKMMNHKMRRHSIDFLSQVNHFLTNTKEKEIKRILSNPKDKLPLSKKIENILDRMIVDPEVQKHKGFYIRQLKNLLKDDKNKARINI